MERKNEFCSAMLSALNNANSILLCTHISPDGDAIGATLAMGLGLEAMGKQVTFACADPVPRQMAHLPGAEQFVTVEDLPGKAFDAAMAIDCAEASRMGDCIRAFGSAPVTFQLDHHPGNPGYARYNAVDDAAPAAGIVVRRLLRALHIPLTKEIAACLYCAISTDTGNFRFSSTTAETFSIMEELMVAGLDLAAEARIFHSLLEEPQARLLGRALNTLHLFADGQCASMRLTGLDYEAAHALPEHNTGIVNYALNLPGVKMAYLAEDRGNGLVKVSLRSVPGWKVGPIARGFGGGGHDCAAAFRREGSLRDVCEMLDRQLEKQVGKRTL